MEKVSPRTDVLLSFKQVKDPFLSSPKVIVKEKQTRYYGDIIVLTFTVDQVTKKVEKEGENLVAVS